VRFKPKRLPDPPEPLVAADGPFVGWTQDVTFPDDDVWFEVALTPTRQYPNARPWKMKVRYEQRDGVLVCTDEWEWEFTA
jgi:hypothetical protein